MDTTWAGEVEFMDEKEDDAVAESEDAKALAKEVADLMRATIRLNVKVLVAEKLLFQKAFK